MQDFLSFRRMLTPVIIQIVFWLGVAGCVLSGLFTMGTSFWRGLVIIVLGPIMVRIWCELVMVVFRINETLTDIRNHQINK